MTFYAGYYECVARYASYRTLVNIDSFLLGHNFNDQLNDFCTAYNMIFHKILNGSSINEGNLCLQRAIIQPSHPTFFVRDGWNIEQHCSFVGSKLYVLALEFAYPQ